MHSSSFGTPSQILTLTTLHKMEMLQNNKYDYHIFFSIFSSVLDIDAHFIKGEFNIKKELQYATGKR